MSLKETINEIGKKAKTASEKLRVLNANKKKLLMSIWKIILKIKQTIF